MVLKRFFLYGGYYCIYFKMFYCLVKMSFQEYISQYMFPQTLGTRANSELVDVCFVHEVYVE